MRGNFHVRFLGGWGAAMLPGYPARLEKCLVPGNSLAAYLTPTDARKQVRNRDKPSRQARVKVAENPLN